MDKRDFYDKAVLTIAPVVLQQISGFQSADDVAARISEIAEALIEQRDRFLVKQPFGYPLHPEKVSE